MTTAHHFASISSPRTVSLLERAKSLLCNRKFEFFFQLFICLLLVNGSFDQKTRPLLVFSGPSGAGKSTLLGRLFRDFPSTFGFSVSSICAKDLIFVR